MTPGVRARWELACVFGTGDVQSYQECCVAPQSAATSGGLGPGLGLGAPGGFYRNVQSCGAMHRAGHAGNLVLHGLCYTFSLSRAFRHFCWPQ